MCNRRSVSFFLFFFLFLSLLLRFGKRILAFFFLSETMTFSSFLPRKNGSERKMEEREKKKEEKEEEYILEKQIVRNEERKEMRSFCQKKS